MADDKDEYTIIDDEPPKMQFNGGGIKVVVKSVSVPVSNVDPDRDVTGLFKHSDGRCLICELPCHKNDCTECAVPRFSQRITDQVMGNITTHRASPTVRMEHFPKQQ